MKSRKHTWTLEVLSNSEFLMKPLNVTGLSPSWPHLLPWDPRPLSAIHPPSCYSFLPTATLCLKAFSRFVKWHPNSPFLYPPGFMDQENNDYFPSYGCFFFFFFFFFYNRCSICVFILLVSISIPSLMPGDLNWRRGILVSHHCCNKLCCLKRHAFRIHPQ